jgi:hypothetical protein
MHFIQTEWMTKYFLITTMEQNCKMDFRVKTNNFIQLQFLSEYSEYMFFWQTLKEILLLVNDAYTN